MQTYDALMILVLVSATVFGFWKGMAWQLASLASLIASYFISLKFSSQLAPYFGQQAPLNRFSAQLAIYVASSFVIWMLFRFVSGAINKVKLQSFDKQLGAMLGFAKGVLLCVAITFFAVTLAPQPQGQAIVASQSGRYIVLLLNKADAVCPPELHQVVGPVSQHDRRETEPELSAAWAGSAAGVAEPGEAEHAAATLVTATGLVSTADLAGVAAIAISAATGVAFGASEPAHLAKCSNGPAEDG